MKRYEVKTEFGIARIPERTAFESREHFNERIKAAERCTFKRWCRRVHIEAREQGIFI